MNIASWLEIAGRSDAGRPAIGIGERVLYDYRSFAERAARLAGALRGRYGLNPGDRVAIVARNGPAFLEILWGVWWAGCAAVPVNSRLHGAEIGFILAQSGARACFASEGLRDEIAPHAPQGVDRLVLIGGGEYDELLTNEPVACVARDDGDLAWLFYTSGTTGRPKGAMLTHGNLIAASYAYMAEIDSIAPGDVKLHAAPMSHGSGIYIMAHVLRRGINLVAESGTFDPAEIFALARHWRNVSMFAAPTMVKRMIEARADCDPSAFRTIVYGGAPMYVEDAIRAIDRFGPCFAQIYGQGESPMTITRLSKAEIADRGHPEWLARLGSAGIPYGCVDVAVVDSEDRPLPTGETGEIVCRGIPVMAGYWENPEATAQTLRGGWLHTGDVGAFDENGYLTLKDRSKDLIISGGSNVYPREVEEVLLAHPGIREVSVIGRPDPEWGEVVVAYVVGESTQDELDALCLSKIARFKRPKEYRFVDALPKNNYGKILKTELREIDRINAESGGE